MIDYNRRYKLPADDKRQSIGCTDFRRRDNNCGYVQNPHKSARKFPPLERISSWKGWRLPEENKVQYYERDCSNQKRNERCQHWIIRVGAKLRVYSGLKCHGYAGKNRYEIELNFHSSQK